MNIQQFDEVCQALHDKRRAIVNAKRPEYTEGNVDVLRNFKAIGEELGVDPRQILYTYFRKHIASIGQFCRFPDRETSEPIEGRIADAMNYLELLHGLNVEAHRRKGDGVPAHARVSPTGDNN